jgi:hypothetical protein
MLKLKPLSQSVPVQAAIASCVLISFAKSRIEGNPDIVIGQLSGMYVRFDRTLHYGGLKGVECIVPMPPISPGQRTTIAYQW